jgi:hypothetical protein
MWLLEDFLRSPTKEAFRLQSLETWHSAVHWLLTSYAPETAIEEAFRSLQRTTQRPTEKLRYFGLRVHKEASLLGPLIPLSELKSLFSQGLCDPVRSNFAAGQAPLDLADHTPLITLICRAELLERGSMGVGENLLPSPPALDLLALYWPYRLWTTTNMVIRMMIWLVWPFNIPTIAIRPKGDKRAMCVFVLVMIGYTAPA